MGLQIVFTLPLLLAVHLILAQHTVIGKWITIDEETNEPGSIVEYMKGMS